MLHWIVNFNCMVAVEKVEKGFVLTCKAYPQTKTVVLDFDTK